MEKRITLPLTAELAKTLHAGDRVLLTGTIYTSRDAGHKRMCEALARGEKIPFDPTDATIYYVGPTPAKPGHVIGSAGPTTICPDHDVRGRTRHDRKGCSSAGSRRGYEEV